MPLTLFKKFLAVALLAGAAGFGLFIIGKAYVRNVGSPEGSAIIAIKPNPSEPLPQSPQDAHGGNTREIKSPEPLPKESAEKSAPGANQTEKVIQSITEEFIKINPRGPSIAGGKPSVNAIKPDALASKIITDQIKNFDLQDFKPGVALGEIKIIKKSDSASLVDYLHANEKILLDNNAPFLTLDPKNMSFEDFAPLALALEKVIGEFYKLPAPEPFAPLHAEEISLLKAEQNIFTALGKGNEDPFKALFAIQAMTLVDQGFNDLKKEYLNFISKNNLKI